MTPRKTSHDWTDFEMHTLLCLMVQGMHLPDQEGGKRSDGSQITKQHAYLNVATALNNAVHGEDNYAKDIDKNEVARMIDLMLKEKKGVVGEGGYMERATRGRITRGLKMMWQREPGFNYNGSLGEWNGGRKGKEAEKRRIAAGGKPREVLPSIEGGSNDGFGGPDEENLWKEAEIAACSLSAPINNREQAPQVAVHKPQRSVISHDGFTRLPSTLRNSDKFAWANHGNAAENRSSLAPRPLIDSYRPSYSQTSSRYEPTANPYCPQHEQIDDDYHASFSSYHFQTSSRHVSDHISHPNLHYRFDLRSDNNGSTPSLIPDYSSSPVKNSNLISTACPSASLAPTLADPITSSTYEEETLARAIEQEITKRKVSSSKKLGILKHRPVATKSVAQQQPIENDFELDEGRDRGPDDGINPARRAMLALEDDDVDVEMAFELVEKARRTAGKDANAEDLPFNRLEMLRQGSGMKGVEK